MIEERPYRDRTEAGRVLADAVNAAGVSEKIDGSDAVVLALPRGGVPVGYEVAHKLGAALDVFVVRKLGLPAQPELAMGAIASGGVLVLNDAVVSHLGVTEDEIAAVAQRESEELARREKSYRENRRPADVSGRVAILVDDGLATGSTMRAAIAAVKQLDVARIVVAVPVGAKETCSELAHEVDLLICPLQPRSLFAIAQWYDDFSQTTDEEVRECLAAANREHTRSLKGGIS
ncbi:MAG TPA: phosphoribosyltransferase [Opitutaceae bacterium]|nr:phosphoribosyltransferase [Opitutaceae bacterium]